MRILSILFIFVVSLLTFPACNSLSEQPISEPTLIPTADIDAQMFEIAANLTAREILPDVFVITHTFPWDENLLLVEMADGTLVMVDTPWTPQATQVLLEWMMEKYGQRRIVAINTHHHIDNLGGNQALIAAGIPVYGSDLTARMIAESGWQDLEDTLAFMRNHGYEECLEDYANMQLVPPTELFPLEEGVTLDFGNEKVEINFPGAAHAMDNVVVYFPDRRLLFGGCMVIGFNEIGNTADADMAAWPDSIQKLKSYDVDIIVPGHGNRLDPNLLDHTLEVLKEYEDKYQD